MCHGISPVSPVQSKHPCKKERWTGKDLPCKFVPVISPSCRGYLVGTYKPRGVPVSYLMQVKNPFFFKKKKKKKKDQATCKLHTASGMQDEAEECEYPSIGSHRSLTPYILPVGELHLSQGGVYPLYLYCLVCAYYHLGRTK